jgi:hypothetical protein
LLLLISVSRKMSVLETVKSRQSCQLKSSLLSLIYHPEYAKSKAYSIRSALLCLLPASKFLTISPSGTTARRDPSEMIEIKDLSPPLNTILSVTNPFHVLTSYFSAIHFNINLLISTLVIQITVSKILANFSSSVFVLQVWNAIPTHKP